MWRQRLPSGREVFTTFPDVLFIFELVFGGLVWILIASSLVPLPLLQGWVMFASVFCFVGTTALFFWYIIGVRDSKTSWKLLVFSLLATLLYMIHACASCCRQFDWLESQGLLPDWPSYGV
nr:PREDICTED: myelin and lymphocyte protein-like isoform X2 [Equus przewalskii]